MFLYGLSSFYVPMALYCTYHVYILCVCDMFKPNASLTRSQHILANQKLKYFRVVGPKMLDESSVRLMIHTNRMAIVAFEQHKIVLHIHLLFAGETGRHIV